MSREAWIRNLRAVADVWVEEESRQLSLILHRHLLDARVRAFHLSSQKTWREKEGMCARDVSARAYGRTDA